MSRLLWYATVLALAAAIGGYILLGPSDEDIVPDPAEREARAHVEPAPPLTPASIEEEELEYVVAKRVASLEGWRAFLAAHPNGAHAQAARAEVENRLSEGKGSADTTTPAPALADNEQGSGLSQRLEPLASGTQSASAKFEHSLLDNKAAAPSNPERSSNASPDAKAASDPPLAVLSASENAVPPRTEAPVSHDESRDAKAADEPTRPAAPPAETDAVAGAQLAALAPADVCQRDEDRLAQLRSNPSRDEATRFANELACERLRPQVLSLMESLAAAAADASRGAVPEPQAHEDATTASPVGGADVAALKSDETCKHDEDRLARLRSTPSGEEAQRFASELGCEALRPQLRRLMESLGLVAPAPRSADASPSSGSLVRPVCASERAVLDRLRKLPSAEATGIFWRDLKCEGLRPQVRLLMESLNVATDSVNSVAASREVDRNDGAASEPLSPNGADLVACRRETAELNRIRATLNFGDAKRFASAVTCEALKPQAARLLESLSE
jgi:hypothetical protein